MQIRLTPDLDAKSRVAGPMSVDAFLARFPEVPRDLRDERVIVDHVRGHAGAAQSPRRAAPGVRLMTSRRAFLQSSAGSLAGIAFVGCDLMAAAPAQAQARRREVMVGGKRVKTEDVHAHCAVLETMALMGLKIGGPTYRPELHVASEVGVRLRAMDEQGIDVEALSINPYWYKVDRDLARQIIKLQ